MNPCPLDGTDQRAWHVLAAGVEPDGPADADGDQALVIDDARHPTLRCAWGHARAWAGRAASCRARGRNPGTATRLANERSGAGQDLGGRDRLPRVARAVLGRVEQEAERRRRQPGPPYCTCRPQIVALVRGCGQACALQTVEPVTYRCGTRRVCQARSSGSERDTRARPHAVAPMNCVPEDSRRRSTCTGRTHSPRALADGNQTPSSTDDAAKKWIDEQEPSH